MGGQNLDDLFSMIIKERENKKKENTEEVKKSPCEIYHPISEIQVFQMQMVLLT